MNFSTFVIKSKLAIDQSGSLNQSPKQKVQSLNERTSNLKRKFSFVFSLFFSFIPILFLSLSSHSLSTHFSLFPYICSSFSILRWHLIQVSKIPTYIHTCKHLLGVNWYWLYHSSSFKRFWLIDANVQSYIFIDQSLYNFELIHQVIDLLISPCLWSIFENRFVFDV